MYAAETTLRAAEWTAIRQVIDDQQAALKAGDGAKAFVVRIAGNPRAVRQHPNTSWRWCANGYGALLAARYTEFLEGAVIDGVVIQPMRIIAPDNSVLVALYTMEKQKDGRWRIAGCVLAPSTVQAA